MERAGMMKNKIKGDKKNHFLTSYHYDVVKTYFCHHKDGFKVKDKVAALQIQELRTDMEYAMYFSSRITEESLWKRYSFQFCEHICTHLVSGASYSRLNNAS